MPWEALHPAAMPVVIFLLRTLGFSVATLRMFATSEGRRWAAWFTGLLQSLLFISALAGVLVYLDNLLNLVAYGAGLATGNVVGMWVDDRVASGQCLIRIFSPTRAGALLSRLHADGFGATELPARGRAGTVGIILCYVPRKQAEAVKGTIIAEDPKAVITIERVAVLSGGWRA